MGTEQLLISVFAKVACAATEWGFAASIALGSETNSLVSLKLLLLVLIICSCVL